jgi:hypothetical protein
MQVEVALGEVVDRVTILRIKARHVRTEAARENVAASLAALERAWAREGLPPMEDLPEWSALAEVNEALWKVEDHLRALEARGDFSATFVAEARSVYRLNDRRAALKRAVDARLGSRLTEEKVYVRPDHAGDGGATEGP